MAVRPSLVAHRFGRTYGPDSSRRALERALSTPIAGVETDCCLTRDGEIVLLHDPLMSRATGLSGWVQELTAEEVTASRLLSSRGDLSDQYPLLLDEGLDLLDESGLLVQLEVKATADEALARATAARVCDVLSARGGSALSNAELISFWPGAAEVGAQRGLATRVIVACAYAPEALANWAASVGVTGVILEGDYFAAVPVQTWRDAGLSVMSGVVNEVELLTRVLAFAPDYIATDRPAELLAELDRTSS